MPLQVYVCVRECEVMFEPQGAAKLTNEIRNEENKISAVVFDYDVLLFWF